jgi:hypothetical protein
VEKKLEAYNEALRNAASLYHPDGNNINNVPLSSDSPCFHQFRVYYLPIDHYLAVRLVAMHVSISGSYLTSTYLYADAHC